MFTYLHHNNYCCLYTLHLGRYSEAKKRKGKDRSIGEAASSVQYTFHQRGHGYSRYFGGFIAFKVVPLEAAFGGRYEEIQSGRSAGAI